MRAQDGQIAHAAALSTNFCKRRVFRRAQTHDAVFDDAVDAR